MQAFWDFFIAGFALSVGAATGIIFSGLAIALALVLLKITL